jgi:hypothetical protein
MPAIFPRRRISSKSIRTEAIRGKHRLHPENTVPIPAGGFVRRVARTPHYDGVKRDAKEPAVIALFGIAPVEFALVDPSKPAWRTV